MYGVKTGTRAGGKDHLERQVATGMGVGVEGTKLILFVATTLEN